MRPGAPQMFRFQLPRRGLGCELCGGLRCLVDDVCSLGVGRGSDIAPSTRQWGLGYRDRSGQSGYGTRIDPLLRQFFKAWIKVTALQSLKSRVFSPAVMALHPSAGSGFLLKQTVGGLWWLE